MAVVSIQCNLKRKRVLKYFPLESMSALGATIFLFITDIFLHLQLTPAPPLQRWCSSLP